MTPCLSASAPIFPEAERASREVLSLPMHPLLTEWDQDRVAAAVLAAVG